MQKTLFQTPAMLIAIVLFSSSVMAEDIKFQFSGIHYYPPFGGGSNSYSEIPVTGLLVVSDVDSNPDPMHGIFDIQRFDWESTDGSNNQWTSTSSGELSLNEDFDSLQMTGLFSEGCAYVDFCEISIGFGGLTWQVNEGDSYSYSLAEHGYSVNELPDFENIETVMVGVYYEYQNYLIIESFTAVPEPHGVLVVLAGCIVLFSQRKRD